MLTFPSSGGRRFKSFPVSSALLANVVLSGESVDAVAATSECIGGTNQSDKVDEEIYKLLVSRLG